MTHSSTTERLRGMVRRSDPHTSLEAAATVTPHLSAIQGKVLDAFERHGAMSARQVEQLPEFAAYGFSTIRKRVSELAAAGLLVHDGVDRTGRAPCTRYRTSEVLGGDR